MLVQQFEPQPVERCVRAEIEQVLAGPLARCRDCRVPRPRRRDRGIDRLGTDRGERRDRLRGRPGYPEVLRLHPLHLDTLLREHVSGMTQRDERPLGDERPACEIVAGLDAHASHIPVAILRPLEFERLQTLAAILKHALEGDAEADLNWLLRLTDSIITYRARYSTRPQWLPVLDLLVRDEANPRSIAFQVYGLRDYVRKLTELFGPVGDETFEGAAARIGALDPGADLRHGSRRLAALLEDCHGAAFRLGEQVSHRFFSHVGEASRQTFAP